MVGRLRGTPRPYAEARPFITGTLALNQALTCNDGVWIPQPITTTRQWIRDASTVIVGATAATYTLSAADQGHTIKCRVIGINDADATTVYTASTATVPGGVDVIAPTVTINQAAGQADPTSSSPILFDVVFSESVTGFTSATISFAGSTVGGTLVAAISGSGPTYTVTVTGMTTAGNVVASIPAAAVVDLSGNANTASTSTDNIVAFTVSAGGTDGQMDFSLPAQSGLLVLLAD